jgi:hypothetical protein
MLIPFFHSFFQPLRIFGDANSSEGQTMNDIERIRKSLADIKVGERGWQKVLTFSEGSFSQRQAQENLRRLAALRERLQNELKKADSGQ